MATTASDKLPDRCLICYSTNVISIQCSSEPIRKNRPPSSTSVLDKHLENVFILRNVLEIPLGNLQTYLMSWGYPEIWISLCQKCKAVIDEAKVLHFEMVAALKRFKKVKERVLKMIRLSNANEETYEYGDVTDPFMEGDRKAKHLAESTFVSVKASFNKAINVIKSEVDLTDDFGVEGGQDLCSDSVHDGDGDGDLVDEENIELDLKSKPNVDNKKTRVKTIKCNKCTRFIRPDLLSEHLRLHEKSPHDCSICGNVFNNGRGLHKHLTKYHRSVYLEQKESLETRKNNKSRTERKLTAVVNDCDTKSNKTVNNKELNKTLNWKSDTDPILSTPSCSTRESGRVKNETGCKIGKTLIDCPLCGNVRFVILDGKSRKLLQHLENCEAFKAKGINEDEAPSNKNITCQLCNKFSFTSSEKLACFEHLLSCDGKSKSEIFQTPLTNRIFECKVCPSPLYFQLEDFIKHHMEHSRNTYKCTKCPRRFPLTSKIVHHWKSQHYEAMKNVQPLCRFTKDISIPEVPWWCPICSNKFTDENLRDSHVETFHEKDKIEKAHKCNQCSKNYYCMDELKLHEEIVHAEKTGKLVKCDLCNSLFATPKQLQKHKMKKHRVDLLICDICATESNCPSSFKVHMQLHQDVKKFSCQECDQSFTTREYLKNHKYRDHTERDPKVNPLVCPHCNRIFYNRSYLRKHISGVHHGNFKFHCHICNQGSQHESHLKRHLAIKHKIGEVTKKFVCTMDGCVAAFDCRSKLNTHLSQHAGKPQFACQFCGKEFYKKEHMRRHELIHKNAESKPYQCEICAKRFPIRNYLYIHMRSHEKSN